MLKLKLSWTTVWTTGGSTAIFCSEHEVKEVSFQRMLRVPGVKSIKLGQYVPVAKTKKPQSK